MKTFIVHVSVDADSKERAEQIVKKCIEEGGGYPSLIIDAGSGECAVVLGTTDEIED